MQRLKTRPQFQAALAGGTVARTPHFALHRLALPPQSLLRSSAQHCAPEKSNEWALFGDCNIWLGAMVPKRWARRAVTRNAIKRQIYNVSQHFESRMLLAAHVVRLRASFDRKHYTSATSEPLKRAVRQELEQLFAWALRQEAVA